MCIFSLSRTKIKGYRDIRLSVPPKALSSALIKAKIIRNRFIVDCRFRMQQSPILVDFIKYADYPGSLSYKDMRFMLERDR